jgi:hypothetical protein
MPRFRLKSPVESFDSGVGQLGTAKWVGVQSKYRVRSFSLGPTEGTGVILPMMAYQLHSVELVFTDAELKNLLNALQIQVFWGGRGFVWGWGHLPLR